MGQQVCVINSSKSFQAINMKLLTIFRLGFNLNLDSFQVRLQYWAASLCNQLLKEFSSNQFETFNRCYKRIEDEHVTFCRQEIHF